VGERSLLLVLSCWIVCTGVKRFLGGIFGRGVGILKNKYTPCVWLRRITISSDSLTCFFGLLIQKQYIKLTPNCGSMIGFTHHHRMHSHFILCKETTVFHNLQVDSGYSQRACSTVFEVERSTWTALRESRMRFCTRLRSCLRTWKKVSIP
jgi:hypothetical protein